MDDLLKQAFLTAKAMQDEIPVPELDSHSEAEPPRQEFNQNDIYRALVLLSDSLAASYAQVLIDLQDDQRLSWAGTAHEIRQILSTLLQVLAPDEQVEAQSWYRKVPNTTGPTQKQRARYILENRGAGSKERGTTEQIDIIDELVSSLVRATYGRASDAAHRFKRKDEIQHIHRYFVAIAYDLLDLGQEDSNE